MFERIYKVHAVDYVKTILDEHFVIALLDY